MIAGPALADSTSDKTKMNDNGAAVSQPGGKTSDRTPGNASPDRGGGREHRVQPAPMRRRRPKGRQLARRILANRSPTHSAGQIGAVAAGDHRRGVFDVDLDALAVELNLVGAAHGTLKAFEALIVAEKKGASGSLTP